MLTRGYAQRFLICMCVSRNTEVHKLLQNEVFNHCEEEPLHFESALTNLNDSVPTV